MSFPATLTWATVFAEVSRCSPSAYGSPMPSRHLVDQEIVPLIEMLPGFQLDRASLEQTRIMMMELGRENRPPTPDSVEVTRRQIPGPAGAPEVGVVISAPRSKAAARPGVLHIHGGGYVMGAPDMGLVTDAAYVTQLGAVVVSVTLTKEHRLVHDANAIMWGNEFEESRTFETVGPVTQRFVVTCTNGK